jgi:eukaryotic-like serine/threonine-protein kinase
MRSSRDVDAQTDIWALGVILFELITGRAPFHADSVTELAIKVNNEPTPSIRSFRPDVPEGLEATIYRCLQKDRRHRYSNVAELALALFPFAPKRAKASVERISGIIQAAGLSASALAVPPSPLTGGTQTSAGTLPAVGRTTTGSTGRKMAVFGAGLVGAFVVVVVVGSVVLWKRGSTHHEDPQAGAVLSASSAVDQRAFAVAPPKPTDTTAVPLVPIDTLPAVPPPTPAPITSPEPTATVKKIGPVAPSPPAASSGTAAASKPIASPPCKLVKTLDANGETHFSCPCAICQ